VQVVDAYLSAGDLSTFIIYALYVGAKVGALAGVISNLILARARRAGSLARHHRAQHLHITDKRYLILWVLLLPPNVCVAADRYVQFNAVCCLRGTGAISLRGRVMLPSWCAYKGAWLLAE